MRLRLPIYLRALLLVGLNLLALAVLLVGWAGWSSLLPAAARERAAVIGDLLRSELSAAPRAQWPGTLASYGERYGVGFSLEGPGMRQDTGADRDGPGFGPPPGPDPGFRAGPPRMEPRPGPEPGGPPPGMSGPGDRVQLEAAGSLGPYRIRIPGTITEDGRRRPLDVVVTAASLPALAGFLGAGQWLRIVLLALGVSALIWAPFFVGLARSILRLKQATQRIAQGRFDVRLPERRGDELGDLGASVNDMAARLQGLMSGQKQFLADVAHETISPLARIQVGLGLLESRVGADAAETLRDVQDDARQMSELLNELLLFSRAGVEAARSPPERIELSVLLAEAMDREALPQLAIGIPDALAVRGQRAMLLRALCNLLRNASRYGGGAIEVAAERQDVEVRLWVRDRGPGVPEAALPQLGQPFYRPDAARTREQGGHGLGLAIVRRCVEACEGNLLLRNREGGGFEAELRLPAA